jgi:hypothetical protein
VEQHNHYLASPNKAHKLRSQRQVIEADKKLIGQIREAGMKPTQVYEFMKEFYGGEENIPFSKKDYDNEIGRECRQYLEANDAQTLSEYLRNKQDPAFFMHFRSTRTIYVYIFGNHPIVTVRHNTQFLSFGHN